MAQLNETRSTKDRDKDAGHTNWLGGIFTGVVLPIVLLAVGGWYGWYLYKHRPGATRVQPPTQARLVDVVTVERSDHPVIVRVMGTVVPARQVELKPQVSGKIISMNEHLIPGGVFGAGDMLLQIEPSDYELAVKQRQSELATAQSNLKLEQGNQAVALQEFELLGKNVTEKDKELVLRQPQLLAVQSALEAAEARLEQAELDLQRTRMTAPFNALVQNKYIDVGTMVSPTTPVVSLIGTDEYWVEAAVPVDELKWLTIPRRENEAGSTVHIYNPSAWGEQAWREGQVLRLSGELETHGRMAQVLISIQDPLALQEDHARQPALLIGSYVRAEIQGQSIASVIKLDRQWLRDGDRVWVVTEEGTLAIRKVKVAYRAQDYVLVTNGLEARERVIITDIAAAVEGLKVRAEGQKEDKSGDAKNKKP